MTPKRCAACGIIERVAGVHCPGSEDLEPRPTVSEKSKHVWPTPPDQIHTLSLLLSLFQS